MTRRTPREIWEPRYAALEELEKYLFALYYDCPDRKQVLENVALATSAAGHAMHSERGLASFAHDDWGRAYAVLKHDISLCLEGHDLVRAAQKAMRS